MKNSILVLFCCIPLVTFAQRYHDPAEILRMVEKSTYTYELDQIDKHSVGMMKVPATVDYGIYLKRLPDGSIVVQSFQNEYGQNPDYAACFQNAEDAFSKDSLDAARYWYKKVLDVASNQSQVMTYIGQTYENEKDYEAAFPWFRRAIDTNYYDYNAHWFLADDLVLTHHVDEAVKEILIAMVLNRNHQRISTSLKINLQIAKKPYVDWAFGPRYEIDSTGDKHISIKCDTTYMEWLSYALCKALWAYEPGYRDSMLVGVNEEPLVVEEKECFLSVLAVIENSGKPTQDPILQTAQKALAAGKFTEFVVYDVILPSHPNFVFKLPRAFIQSIPDYILTCRASTY